MTREEMAEQLRRNEHEFEHQKAEYARMTSGYEAVCRQAALDAQMIVIRAQLETSERLMALHTQKRIAVAM